MKRSLSLILSLLMLMSVWVTLPAVNAVAAADGLKDSGINYTESTEIIRNPHLGYPGVGYLTIDDYMVPRNDGERLFWYYVNLQNFSGGNEYLPEDANWPEDRVDRPITEKALEAFRQTLENLRQNGGTCFMRFVYNWDGTQGTEPTDFEYLILHLEQMLSVAADFADVCMGFECGMIGPFGEMWGTKYSNKIYANRIIDTYLNNTPESMRLMLRAPGYISNYLGITVAEMADYVAEPGTPEYRLSFYNDGYMNDNGDLGTWADRARDLKFVSRQADHGPYGGEYGTGFWLLPQSTVKFPENALPEMYQTHVNFIRGNVYHTDSNDVFGYDSYTYGPEYEKEWFPDNSAFYGVDCHTFIRAHFGYRMVVRQSRLTASPKAGGTLTLKGKIENTGFGNLFTESLTQILLVGNGYTYLCDTTIDAGSFKSCEVTDYATTLQLPASMPAGEYKVYMRVAAGAKNTEFLTAASGVRFANNGEIYHDELGANYIGSINIAASDVTVSAANDVFCEVGSDTASGNITAGAPLLIGYGIPATDDYETITLNYHTGDTLTLSALNSYNAKYTPTFRWYRGTSQVSTEETLVIENLSKADEGTYKLSVTVNGGNVITVKVKVTVDEHTFGDYSVTKAAGCHNTGTEKRSCSHCSLTETRVIPASEHVEGEPEIIDSTCVRRGSTTVKCVNCSDVLTYQVYNVIPHDYEDTEIVRSCLRGGKLFRQCTVCDAEIHEAFDAPGHDYVYVIEDGKAVGTCSRCKETTDKISMNGITTDHCDSDDIENDKGAISLYDSPAVLIGEGGYFEEVAVDSDEYLTVIFRIDGLKAGENKLGKFRITGHSLSDADATYDSNDSTYYSGSMLYPLDGNGYYALTTKKSIMAPSAKDGWGVITSMAFNDPLMSEKGKESEIVGKDASIELLGIYSDMMSYLIVYTDADGRFLQGESGVYNSNITTNNRVCAVYAIDELFEGETPTKRADKDTVYTFSHWVNQDGEKLEYAVGNHIMTPVFTESENTCAHRSIIRDVILDATCTEKGKGAEVCVDCGAVMGDEYDIDPTTHKNEVKIEREKATFKVKGKCDVYCDDCHVFLRSEQISQVANSFTDVNVDGWYSEAVSFALYNGLFGGTSATTFAPNANMTRAMFVTVLGRLSGVEVDNNATTVFTDVKKGQYYTGYVAWAHKYGIVNGRSADTFAPNALITREEMCVMLVRYCEFECIQLKTNPSVDSFADKTKFSKWAINQIETCRRTGLVGGKGVDAGGGALFMPKGNATRAEVATIIYNLRTKHIDV